MSSKMRKILIVLLSMVLIALFVEAYYLFIKKEQKNDIVFSFENKALEAKTIDYGSDKPVADNVLVSINGLNYDGEVSYDDSSLDMNKLGTYIVKYFIVYKKKKYEKKQTITIVDKEAPEIKLTGGDITLLVGEAYQDPGYTANDNYDGDISDKVVINNDLNNGSPGSYSVNYKVEDSSGNASEATRKITVRKPYTVVATPPKEVKVEIPKVVETNYENTLKANKFTSSNIYLEGYVKDTLEENKLRLVGDSTIELPLTVTNNSYSINIDASSIPNGTYKLYINEEVLLNKMAPILRLNRGKVGSKLVTFSYNEQDEVNIKIEDHYYSYDILINPGHGGEDTGAVNEYVQEKEMNLTVSLYEKCRYEAHGLRVYMTRTTDVYGNGMGPSGLNKLHRVAYEMGHYGAVSKYVYSNHHNSIGNNYYSGYEVLIGGAFTASELTVEKNIASRWNQIFDLTESHLRFYARDYDTEQKYSKLNGEVYTFKDNYAVNRIPYQTANVKAIIYEGTYMSNKNEFTWYWLNNNWYSVSEAKIEEYLKALGVGYNPDNSSCL